MKVRGEGQASHHHVPVALDQAVYEAMRPMSSDLVVIPARNERGNIQHTIHYLLSIGFAPTQILVLINNTTDNTREEAQSIQGVGVRCQDEVLDQHNVYQTVEKMKLPRHMLKGKGTAMFAASLVLSEMDRDEDDRILFLDADITNVSSVDPIRHLLLGWKRHQEARLIKLAAHGRNNEGMHAYFGIPDNPFANLGCLQWPLCGQMSLRWKDLRTMRLTTGYSVEVAMMVDLLMKYGPHVLAEVAISKVLHDKQNDDGVHVRMYRTIVALLHALWMREGRSTGQLSHEEVAAFNHEQSISNASFWVPQPPGVGANKKEAHPLDCVLPTVAECT